MRSEMNISKIGKFFMNIALVCGLLAVAGCGIPAGKDGASVAYQVTDEFGHTLTFTKKPERIYASTLGLNEILIYLVDPGRITALPQEAYDEKDSLIYKEAQKVGRKLPETLSTEQILALKPDLVIMQTAGDRDKAATLRDMGIPVCEMKPALNYEGVVSHIRMTAQAVGEEEKGQEILREMERKLEKVRTALSSIPEEDRKILMAYSMNGVFGSKDGLFHQICTMAGVKNGAALGGLERGGHLSKEKILAINPDYFLFPERAFVSRTGEDIDGYIEEVLADPALQGVKAVQKGQIIKIKDRYRYASSQYFADAVYEIASRVYPGAFGK